MVSETDVVMAYRLLMGRESENPQIVTNLARQYKTLEELRTAFMTSPEFLEKLEKPLAGEMDTAGTKTLTWPAASVEVQVAPDVLERMVKRIEGEFLYLGTR